MARRKSSGLFETLAKAVFQTGTTVHRKTDWLGRRVTVVTHHDSGKTKKYTHGTGLFGNTTRTETRKGGRVVERGKIKKSFWTGTPVERAERTDRAGQQVTRKYGTGFFGNKMQTTVTDPDGAHGSGTTRPGFIHGTRTNFTSHQICRHCGTSVSSINGSFQCSCGRRWGRR